MQKLYYFLIICFFQTISVTAQDKVTINGYIKDASNGEALIGATVYVRSLSAGTTTNVYGFYSLTLPAGTYDVEFTYIGYAKQVSNQELIKNIRFDVEMESQGEQLKEVVISAEKEQSIVQSVEMSVNKLDIKTISKIPAFLGEVDVIRSLQQLPGVATVGEGASGFNVRGGSVGQNLILLDEASVYNSSHLLGFFSVFNPDAVKDTKLYKAAIPAQYGGRLASLLDVRMKEGNNKEFEANGGIGTIFSRLALEAPIVKDKGSFIVAGRRSYIDVLARPFVEVLQDGAKLNFYDLTGKANYSINEKNKIFLSGYFGRDVFFFDGDQGFSWGNKTGTLRYNRIFNDRLFANFSAIFSEYDYSLQFGEDDQDYFRWKSSITNYTFKPNFSYFLNSDNEISFGAEATYYEFTPADAVASSGGGPIPLTVDRKYNLENSFYLSNDQKIGDAFTLQYGLRYSSFYSFGPGKNVIYYDTIPGKRRRPNTSLEQEVSSGDVLSQYSNLEPRLSIKAQLNNTTSIKASYNRMVQYLHLISNTTASNPLDVWTPSSNNILPEIGDQLAVGYFKSFGNNDLYQFSAETYYRQTENQIDYIDGANLLINQYLEGELLSGRGRAYGLELYFQKQEGRFNGWISYTLGKTELQVEGINRGDWYATRYDQRHNLKLTGFYELNKRLSLSANFTYVSGTPATFPTSRYVVQGILIPYNANESRGNVRLPDFHRLDLSVRLDGKAEKANGKQRKNTDYWVFGLYNVYARKNPFSIYFTQGSERVPVGSAINSEARQLAIIGTIIPSISYNFHF
ncbi:TonB-dependent receptor [Chryseotalea sanaruensis]|uniref:TonB-dependent receptor n=1 Tax=Chryseotalea sanaruensis TaxID=2482724 RepID=A0A401U4R4_9BACT|nr:TonB-dependent receptor [Chryseotalea sanaruensis]GCC49891.1 TonB-dependent receptor [Chryseotalea sanaruensis]